MNIEILTKLQDNSTSRSGLTINEGLSEVEIVELEQLYNSGVNFPKALREILYLGGSYCWALETGGDSQQEFQDFYISELMELFNLDISRNIYFVDAIVDYAPIFMYLDEGDNPKLCQIEKLANSTYHIKRMGITLKDLIEVRILKGI